MAMILDAFVSSFAEKLATLVEERVVLLLGVKDELIRLQQKMETIKTVLADAERRRIQDLAINDWLNKLKDVMYEADDIIDLCRYEAGNLLEPDQAASPSSNPPVRCLSSLLVCFRSIPMRHEIGRKIENINNRLEEIQRDKLMFALDHTKPSDHHVVVVRDNARMTSPLLDADVVGDGIKIAAEELVKRILSMEGKQHQVLAIVGMGGIGKTALAQKVFNDPTIKNSFSIRVWACVSQNYSAVELLKRIIRSSGSDYGRADSVEELHPKLQDVLSGKRFFLVLDDVWQSDVWSNLLQVPVQSGEGSGRILITTRDHNVAKRTGAVHIHQVEQLSINSGWELLCRRAYLDREEDVLTLRDVGIKIVEKCGGLPLAIRAVAGTLATKDKNKREWDKILGSNAWSMSELPEELRGALYLSYEDLSPELKQCFLYCSLFPDDYILERKDLIRFWVAEGFVKVRGDDQIMEDTAEEYYNELTRRSLLQLDPLYTDGSICSMHDLLWSLAKYLSQSESFHGDPQMLEPTVLSKIHRLSIAEEGDTVGFSLILETKKRLCLRTLQFFNNPQTVENHLLLRLPYLRVLHLTKAIIDSIPDSLGALIHLRLLDLGHTNISKLPDSLSRLTNLEILNLQNCDHLHTLPQGLTRLCNLRRLGIAETPLNNVPKGIWRLQLLNDLEGFVVAGECVSGEMQDGWDLKELESLDQLRWVRIEKLERATDVVPMLETKCHLRMLHLYCTLQAKRAIQQPYPEEEIIKIEEIFEKLSAPPCLEDLTISGFFGRRYPSYMSTSFSSLTRLRLFDCISCPLLPPLGQLPNLRILIIVGALAVVTIGLEFLGNGFRAGLAKATAFPKLEFLHFMEMPNWEEWSLGDGIEAEGVASVGKQIAPSSSLSPLPHLQDLGLTNCPRLRALPERLKEATMLKRLYINRAHSLRTVENLPSLTQWLQIIDSNSIERVSNLPQLRELFLVRSPVVRYVQNLDVLQTLYLEDESMECLPECISGFLQQRQHHNDLKFRLECNLSMLERCAMGRQDWPIIQLFPEVNAHTTDGSSYVSYTKSPFRYDSNLPELRDTGSDSESTPTPRILYKVPCSSFSGFEE